MGADRKVVLVTGGSSGIGRATAGAFARTGAAVVIASRNAEKGEAACVEIRGAGGEAEFVQTDVSRVADVERLVQAVVERFGRLDVAVNNAATIDVGVFKDTAGFDEAEFDAHIGANLKSVWACMKYEIAQMRRQQDGGAIVNVSSVNGLGGVPHNALYAAAKAGVLALTRCAAVEAAPHGVRVNAVVPSLAMHANLAKVTSDELLDELTKVEAMGRSAEPWEVANVIVFLASDLASFMTGEAVSVSSQRS